MKKALSVLIAVLLLFSLTACGAKSESAAGDMMAYPESPAEQSVNGMEFTEGWYDKAETEEAIEEESATPEPTEAGGSAAEAADTIAEKIIYSATLSMESTEFDKTLATVEGLIEKYGGYVQSSNVSGDTYYNNDGTTSVINRYAYYTIAVPAEHFETFLTESGNAGNVTSTYRYAENITSAYTDTEARINSLRVQEERLMAMMEETGDLESLIALEARLAEVTYEIESYQRQINDWDRRVSYSTIDIELREVNVYTPTVPVTRTFGEKLADAFSDGWRGFSRGIQNFILWFAESLPTLILWAIILTGGAFLILKVRKRCAAKKASKRAAKDSTTPPTDDFPR